MTSSSTSTPLLLLGGAADAADVQHATGFSAPDPFVCILDRGWAHLIVSSLELGRARAVTGNVVSHASEELDVKPEHRGPGGQALAFLRARNQKRVRVSVRCPVGVVRFLETSGINVDLQPDPVRPGRVIKGPEEIEKCKAAQRAAVAGIHTAEHLIRTAAVSGEGVLLDSGGSPLTSERVRAAIAHTLLDHGCHAEELIVAGGDQAVDPHQRGEGPLRACEWIILDVFPRSASGYWGDITRTVMKGKPSPEQKRLFQTVKKAQAAAVRQVKAGVHGTTIHEGIVKAFASAGYTTGRKDGIPQGFIHSTGHGVGLDIHEAPRIAPGAGALRAGMIVTIEPGLYYRGLGGVRIEDTVVVTREGYRPLARCGYSGVLA